ncbi:phosphotransferase family protein [Nocardia sp. CNY236]|uniref:phosphotransferase family protein n=1 Tax=Nocardia sp. CNY236 TaxID=1169152 RepID=UPI0018CB4707|nr:aminoglycoside phosphotransferase family protein [Nocardia sp. CNY236]
MYALTSRPVVVKIGRPDRSGSIDIVDLVHWLEDHAVPTVSLIDVEQPLTVGGCPVTFWQYLEQERGITSAIELAEPLTKLHSCPTRPTAALPDRQIRKALSSISQAIQTSTILTPEDRRVLLARQEELAQQSGDIRYALDTAVIHGDAQHRNALWDNRSQRAVLCDWDTAAIGPPEWDLVTVEVHCRRFGHAADEFEQFSSLYGFDIREWDGYEWLRDLRELKMITTNARKSEPGSATEAEILRRIDALRRDMPLTWQIL